MKNLSIIMLSVFVCFLTSCATVDSGHKGVEVSWGGETNLNQVHGEGLHTGFMWLFNDMVLYDVREYTIVEKFDFNDKNNMTTGVELSVDLNLDPNKVNLLHTEIKDVQTKILKTLKSAGKEVVPQYSAVELNITKRTEAEQKLSEILSNELPEFYVQFARVQMTDVDIPKEVAKLAEETAVQLGRNKLAEKKEDEQKALAKAKIAKAEGDFKAAEFDAKRKEILSNPKLLELKKLEVQMAWAERGVSPYGSNNVFGSQTAVVKGLK